MTGESKPPPPAPSFVAGAGTLLTWIRRHPIALSSLFACVLVAAALVPALQLSGYCFEQQRFPTDRDYINAAIAGALERETATVVRLQERQLNIEAVPLPRHAGVEEFVEKNPQCCEFTPHNAGDQSPNVTFGDRVSGSAARTVLVRVPLDRRETGGEVVSLRVVVTNCGYVRR